MPFDGSGNYRRSYSWQSDASNGINILAQRMDTEDNGFATALSNCITRDGQSPALANLPMGGFVLTGLGIGVNDGDSVNVATLKSSGLVWFAAGKSDYDPVTHTWATDNLPAWLALVAQYPDGVTIYVDCGDYYFSQSPPIPDNVMVQGKGNVKGNKTPANVLGNGTNFWIGAGATGIQISNSSRMDCVNIWAYGTDFNITSAVQIAHDAAAGTGVIYQEGTTDMQLSNLMIIGFQNGIAPSAQTATTSARMRLENVLIDCVNGVHIHNFTDIPRFRDVHKWPIRSIFSVAEPNGANLKRNGIGYYFTGTNDHAMVGGCFDYGTLIAYQVDAGHNLTFYNCDADYPFQSVPDGSIGYYGTGDVREWMLTDCQAPARDYSFRSDAVPGSSANGFRSTMNIRGGMGWAFRISGVHNNGGNVFVQGGYYESTVTNAVAVSTGASSLRTSIMGITPSDVQNVINNFSTTTICVDHGGNNPINVLGEYNVTATAYRLSVASAASTPIPPSAASMTCSVTGGVAITTFSGGHVFPNKTIPLFFPTATVLNVTGNIVTKTGAAVTIPANTIEFFFVDQGTTWRQFNG
jgi:hypothetical protein